MARYVKKFCFSSLFLNQSVEKEEGKYEMKGFRKGSF